MLLFTSVAPWRCASAGLPRTAVAAPGTRCLEERTLLAIARRDRRSGDSSQCVDSDECITLSATIELRLQHLPLKREHCAGLPRWITSEKRLSGPISAV